MTSCDIIMKESSMRWNCIHFHSFACLNRKCIVPVYIPIVFESFVNIAAAYSNIVNYYIALQYAPKWHFILFTHYKYDDCEQLQLSDSRLMYVG